MIRQIATWVRAMFFLLVPEGQQSAETPRWLVCWKMKCVLCAGMYWSGECARVWTQHWRFQTQHSSIPTPPVLSHCAILHSRLHSYSSPHLPKRPGLFLVIFVFQLAIHLLFNASWPESIKWVMVTCTLFPGPAASCDCTTEKPCLHIPKVVLAVGTRFLLGTNLPLCHYVSQVIGTAEFVMLGQETRDFQKGYTGNTYWDMLARWQPS